MIRKILFVLYTFIIALTIGCAPTKRLSTPTVELKEKGMQHAKTNTFISDLLARYPLYFDTLLKHNDKWHIQIIYTQINRTATNKPVFTNYYFGVDSAQYYYPASTVKMPVAFLALQKLNELNIAGLNRNTTLITEAAYSGQEAVYNDPSSADGRPTIAQYIKKIFLVSNNDAFNRLYEFLGQEYINNTLHQMGYDSAQIVHRLNISRTEDENRHTNPAKFYDSEAKLIYSVPMQNSKLPYQARKTFLGKGYYNDNQLVKQPFDFSKKNRLTLQDVHSILSSIIFPDAVSPSQRFKLTPDDYHFLYQYMSMKPQESAFPQYDTSYPDAYSKLLLYGGRGEMDADVRIFNKEGDAYGFLTDAAYIVDFKNNIEFLLSATIYCNSDGIFNDDKYDYDTVGYPFLKNLGKVIYDYELQRKRKNTPDLSSFKMTYSK